MLADDCECGVKNPDTRIVGGEETEPNEYPWQVALVNEWLPNFVFCGGTVVNSKFVMTAAHCTEGKDADELLVKVGEHDLAVDDDDARLVGVKTIHEHPGYDDWSAGMDFAILELRESLNFSTYVRPACLPTMDVPYAGVRGNLVDVFAF